jgi:hypothetical protein
MANGFLFDIKAVVDKQSFQNGIASIENVAAVSKKAILGITGIATALIATASKASEVATAEMKMANAIGVSSDALANWKTSASIAGASADGLISSLSSIESKMQHLKMGEVDSGLAKNLAMMNIGYGEFANMDSNQRMSAVFGKASEMQDQRMASQLIQDTLGKAGREYYDMLKLSGKSLKEQMAEAKALNFVSESSRKKAVLFGMEMRAVKEAGASILKLFGMELAGAITPTIRKVKKYLISNREQIRKGISGVAQSIGAVFNAIFGVLAKVTPLVTGLIDNFGGLTNVVIKLGVGFASMKLLKVASGLKSVALGIKSVKSAVSGLAGGLATMGLGMLLEDVVSHFMGGNSLIFDFVIPKMKEAFAELKEMLDLDVETDGIQELIKGFKDLGDNLKKAWDNAKPLKDVLKEIADITLKLGFKLFLDSLNDSLTRLNDMAVILGKLLQGDISGAMEYFSERQEQKKQERTTKKEKALETVARLDSKQDATTDERIELLAGAGTVFKSNLEEERAKLGIAGEIGPFGTVLGLPSATVNTVKDIYDAKKQREQQHSSGSFADTETTTTNPPKKKGLFERVKSFFSGDKDNSINDGIISPNGHVTQLNPNDWVFAVKDISDLASGFLPNVTTNNNGNTTNNATYTINQSFVVNGNGSNIRQQAYNGTAEALRATVNTANQRLQMMSGAR